MTLQMPGSRTSDPAFDLEQRALALWPRLDRAALRRCGRDPARMADLIAQRTALSPETVRQVLLMPTVSDDDLSTWFG